MDKNVIAKYEVTHQYLRPRAPENSVSLLHPYLRYLLKRKKK